jgi:hypothetical protein
MLLEGILSLYTKGLVCAILFCSGCPMPIDITSYFTFLSSVERRLVGLFPLI